MKTKFFFLPAVLFLALGTKAQEFSYKCKSGFLTYGTGYMMNDKCVTGYYYFTEYDKIGKDTFLYKLEIFDNNLKSTHIINVKRPPKSVLVGVVNNGETFCVELLNAGLNAREFILYNKKGEETGAYRGADVSTVDIKDSYEASNVIMPAGGSMLNCFSTENIIPLTGGYLCTLSFKSKGNKQKVIMFDNVGKMKWEYIPEAPEEKCDQEIKIVYAKDFVAAQFSSYKGRFPRKRIGDVQLDMVGITDGKWFLSIKSNDSTESFNLKGVYCPEKSPMAILYGEETELTGPANTPKGSFFAIEINTDSTRVTRDKVVPWKDFIGRKTDLSLSECVQDILKLSNGKYYCYINTHDYFPNSEIKVLSTKDEAKNTLLEGIVKKDENISDYHDFFILECDSAFGNKKVHAFKKDKTIKVAGYNYGKSFYADLARTQWFVVHAARINDRQEGSGYGALCVGTADGNDLSVEKILLKDNPDRYELLPAKSGYVLLMEYLKKDDLVKVKLIKMDI